MRFSIRDLLWLTAVVALAATVWNERALLRSQSRKWQAEKEILQQQSANAHAAIQANVNRLREENALLRHQAVVQMERQRQREMEAAQRQGLVARPGPTQPAIRPLADDAEN